MGEERLLRFPLGRESFALRLADASQLADVRRPAPVPHAPGEIAGVVDVRGRIVTLVELARLVGLPSPERPRRRAILFAPPQAHLALLVGDEVEILVTDLDRARPQEAGSAPPGSRPTCGLLTREGLLVNLVDPAAVAAACERLVRERFHRAD